MHYLHLVIHWRRTSFQNDGPEAPQPSDTPLPLSQNLMKPSEVCESLIFQACQVTTDQAMPSQQPTEVNTSNGDRK